MAGIAPTTSSNGRTSNFVQSNVPGPSSTPGSPSPVLMDLPNAALLPAVVPGPTAPDGVLIRPPQSAQSKYSTAFDLSVEHAAQSVSPPTQEMLKYNAVEELPSTQQIATKPLAPTVPLSSHNSLPYDSFPSADQPKASLRKGKNPLRKAHSVPAHKPQAANKPSPDVAPALVPVPSSLPVSYNSPATFQQQPPIATSPPTPFADHDHDALVAPPTNHDALVAPPLPLAPPITANNDADPEPEPEYGAQGVDTDSDDADADADYGPFPPRRVMPPNVAARDASSPHVSRSMSGAECPIFDEVGVDSVKPEVRRDRVLLSHVQ